MNKAVPIGSGTAFPRDAQVRYVEGGRAKLVEEPDLTTLKDVKFFVRPLDFPSGGARGKGGPGGGRGGAPYGRGARHGGQVTSIFSSNDGVQQIFGDEGENAQDFDKWMEGIMNGGTDVCSAAQHIAAPVLGNLANVFGNSPDGDGASILWLQGPGSGVRSREVGCSVALWRLKSGLLVNDADTSGGIPRGPRVDSHSVLGSGELDESLRWSRIMSLKDGASEL